MSLTKNINNQLNLYEPYDDFMLYKYRYLNYKFTIEHECEKVEYASKKFEKKYCYEVGCYVKPFYLGCEIYYNDEYPHKNKKTFLHKFVLIANLNKRTILDENTTDVFTDYLLQAALM